MNRAAGKTRRILSFLLYLLFVSALCGVCFIHPAADDFDRFIYEALVRARHQDINRIYSIVKHESPRAEASSVLDSPEHLAQLEPLYAIRPLYLMTIEIAARTGMPVERAINLVSALSLFCIGMVLYGWTRRPVYCALLMMAPAIVALGRLGTPDALSSLLIFSSLWALARQRIFPGVLLLLVSIWARTDNVLIVIFILLGLALSGRLSLSHSAVLAALAAASVTFINHFSGNYGWSVLFRYSFIAGRYPAEIASHVTWREYILVFGRGLEEIGGQELPLWTLLGIAAWRWSPPHSAARRLLVPILLAAMAHFMLFPTPQDRYFAWAYLVAGAFFIEAIGRGPYLAGGRSNPALAR